MREINFIGETEAKRQVAALDSYNGHKVYGMEWGSPRATPRLKAVVDLIDANINGDGIEIGSGGGRWTDILVDRCESLIAVDATEKSKLEIRKHLLTEKIKSFLISHDGSLPIVDSILDFAFSFDTFVHFHPRLFNNYLETVGRILKNGGVFFLHYAVDFGQEEYNPVCFQYREPFEILTRARTYNMHPSGSLVNFDKAGYGSQLLLLRKWS